MADPTQKSRSMMDDGDGLETYTQKDCLLCKVSSEMRLMS